MKKLFLNTLMVVTALFVANVASAAGINKGLYKKAAKKVWSMPADGIFNSATVIPDSLASANSAVVIAAHDDFVADRVEQNTIYSRTGRTNRTTLEHVRRRMVKILDNAAIDYFSEFEFGSTDNARHYGAMPESETNRAFGARIHKADGAVIEIDPATALEVSDGKKGGKNKHFKLAVPGLEVGDVLEYFYYTEYRHEDGDIDPVDVSIASRYPVLKGLITGTFDPDLTIEFYAYNGATPVTAGPVEKENNTVHYTYDNVPAVTFTNFLFDERQLPFVRLNTINNYLAPEITVDNRPRYARRAGVYPNVKNERILNEMLERIGRIAGAIDNLTKPVSHVPSNAAKTIRAWKKVHPEATERQVADAAWMAVMYHSAIDDDEVFVTPLFLALYHNDVLHRLDLFDYDTTGLGFVNGRDEVPLDEVSKWSQTHFISVAGDTAYIMNPPTVYAPGEVPARFQGESAARVTGKLTDLTYNDHPDRFNMADRKYSGNKMVHRAEINLDPDRPGYATFGRTVILAGSRKELVTDFTSSEEWVAATEDFLNIEKSKRWKPKDFDAEDRRRELNDAAKDECELLLGVRPDTITAFDITSRGMLPGNTTFDYTMSGKLSEMTEDLGDGISVSIGRLFGNNIKLEGNERTRLLDALFDSAYTDTYVTKLVIPEGYSVDTTSLESLGRQVVNPVGQFIVQAQLDEDGNVVINYVKRIRYHGIALAAWPSLLEILDAAAAYTDASLILTRN